MYTVPGETGNVPRTFYPPRVPVSGWLADLVTGTTTRWTVH